MSFSTPSPISEPSTQWMPWLVCFSASLFFFYEFIQGNMFASINHEIMVDFNTDLMGCSWMSSMYYLANVIFLFPAGVILDRYSTKKVILFSLMTCILGTFFFAFSDSYKIGLICRFVTGIGSAFCFLSCFQLASRWFPPNKMALVTGLIVTLAMTGGMVAQGPFTRLVVLFGWRNAVILDGMLGLFIALIIFCFVKDHPYEKLAHQYEKGAVNHHSFFKSLKIAYGNKQNILAGLYTSLMNTPVAVLGAFAGSVYLTQAHHYERFEAASINSMIFLGIIIGGPLFGHFSDRIGLRKMPMMLSSVLSIFIIFIILFFTSASIIQMKILFFVLGLVCSAQVLSYPLVAENNSLSMTATSVSVVSVITQGGFVIYQTLFSYLLKTSEIVLGGEAYIAEAYRMALMLLPCGFFISLLAVFLLKETFGQRIEERL